MKKDIQTQKYFNKIAEKWNDQKPCKEDRIRTLLAKLELNVHQHILDIGCGTGVLFPLLTQLTNNNANIFAIDFSQSMTTLASQFKPDSIDIICSDVQRLPFSPGKFDRVVAFQVFPHIHHKILALKESWRVLKPGGTLGIVHLHSSEEINAFHAEVGGAVKNHILPSGKQMSELLKLTNFNILSSIDQPGLYFMKAEKKYSHIQKV